MTLLFLLLFCHALCSSDEPRLWASVPLEALHHHAREAGRSGDEELALDYLGAVEARLSRLVVAAAPELEQRGR